MTVAISRMAAPQRHGELDAADGQRQYQQTAGLKLVQPGRGDVPRPGRDDDPVERRAGRVAVAAVRAQDGDLVVACRRKARARACDEVGVDVDADHLAAGADHLGHDGCVVASAGPDLENPVPRLETELVEHDRHHRWLGRRAHRQPVRPALDHEGLVPVGGRGADFRHEHVPWHAGERILHRTAQRAAAAAPQLLNQAGASGVGSFLTVDPGGLERLHGATTSAVHDRRGTGRTSPPIGSARLAAPPGHRVQRDPGCHAGVQRLGRAAHRNAGHHITALGHEPGKALAFRADDQHQRRVG